MGESGTGPSRVSPQRRSSEQSAWSHYLQRSAKGDQSALTALYDESSRLVYATALRILQGSHDAEEVTMDVYMQVWRGAKDYNEQRGSVAAWLVMLARSRAIDRLRSRESRTRREEPLKDFTEFRSTTPGPEQVTEATQHRRRVLVALEVLPPEQREVVELAFFSGFTHSELAIRLNQPLGTVKTRVRQGMIKLREFLAEPA